MDNRSIGFFDSGVGGLSVLKVSLGEIPRESYIYYGDTLRMPYGVRSKEDIERYTCQAMEFFRSKNVKMAVIACNTATCYGIKKARELFDFPIFGVVEPAVKESLHKSKSKKVALLATEGTVNSGVYDKFFESYSSNIYIKEIGCPDLVLAIENGDLRDEVIVPVINKYLDKLEDFEYDALILGCTHFPIVENTFKRILAKFDRKVQLVDPAEITINELKEYMENHDMLGDHDEESIDFYVSSHKEKFKSTLEKLISVNDYKISLSEKVLD